MQDLSNDSSDDGNNDAEADAQEDETFQSYDGVDKEEWKFWKSKVENQNDKSKIP